MVFNQDKLDVMSHHTSSGMRYKVIVPSPVEGEAFDHTRISLEEDGRGELEVFSEPDPDREYCIGADIAEELEGGDASFGYVIDDDIFAKQLDYIGRWSVRMTES